jgi:hypothetical protein
LNPATGQELSVLTIRDSYTRPVPQPDSLRKATTARPPLGSPDPTSKETTMRSRIVLFVILAIVTALVSVWLGWPTTTPKAVGEPATTTQAHSPVGPTQRQGSGFAPSRTPTPSLPKATPPKATPPKAPAPKATPPKATPPKACTPQAATQPAAYTTAPGQESQTEPASQPQLSTDPVRLGKVTTTPSNSDTTISEDRSALTTMFEDREVRVDPGLTDCDATRSLAMTLPLTDGAKGQTLRVHVQGYAHVEKGASARLTLNLNGQVKVRDYPIGWDDSVFETLQVPAIPATTYQLSGTVEVRQDPDTGGTAYLNVITVDIEIS